MRFLKRTGLGCFPHYYRARVTPRNPAEGRWLAKPTITANELRRPLVIKSLIEWLLIRDFHRLGASPPFAYHLSVRSCPNPGCAPDDSKFVLPARRQKLLRVSLKLFLKTGRFWEITLGTTRRAVGQILGEPDLDPMGGNRRNSSSWYYDDFSIGFKNNKVDRLGFFAPNRFRLPAFLQFSDFALTANSTFDEFKIFAVKHRIPVSLQTQDELVFPSGVVIRRHRDLKCCSLLLLAPNA